MRLSLYCGLPFLRRDLSLRRVLAVRIWRDLLFLIGCVIESREEHLCLVHVLFWSSDVCWMLSAACYWSSIWFLMWIEWTCGEVELCQSLVSEVELGSGLMVGFFSQFCGIWDGPWFVEIYQILVSEVDLCSFDDIVWDPSEVCCWGGSCWCRRRNLLLLIRFQHGGVCEAWTPGSWLPWWTI